jgi:hypothetical protein
VGNRRPSKGPRRKGFMKHTKAAQAGLQTVGSYVLENGGRGKGRDRREKTRGERNAERGGGGQICHFIYGTWYSDAFVFF